MSIIRAPFLKQGSPPASQARAGFAMSERHSRTLLPRGRKCPILSRPGSGQFVTNSKMRHQSAMFVQNTCFVVGAGASCELKLPDGNSLKRLIKTRLTTTQQHIFVFEDAEMREAVRLLIAQSGGQREVTESIRRAADAIRTGIDFAPSIDNFLHLRQEDEWIQKVGKAAIACCILNAESDSHLFYSGSSGRQPRGDPQRQIRPSLGHPALQDAWHTSLARIAFSQVTLDELPNALQRLEFVIFNYDRCLEQFLWLVLQSLYGIEGREAAELLAGVNFLHPYGSLGPLPWQDRQTAVPLGAEETDLFAIGQGLRTFLESVDEGVASQARSMLKSASTTLFLGFGFLKQNLDLIRPAASYGSLVLGTAYGMAEANRQVAEEKSRKFADRSAYERVFVTPVTCRALLEDFSLMLTD